MNIKEIEKLCGRQYRRGKFTLDLLKIFAGEVLDKVRWDGDGSLLLISALRSDFADLTPEVAAQGISAGKPVALLRYSDKIIPLEFEGVNGLVLAVADGRRSALLYAEPQESLPARPQSAHQLVFNTLFTVHPAAVAGVVEAFVSKVSNANRKKALLKALPGIIPAKARYKDWQFFGFNVVRETDQQLRTFQKKLTWTEFGYDLENKLGDFLPPDDTLRVFSEFLKQRLLYDYFEISILPGAFANDDEALSMVDNATGLGGKLLSIILKDRFQRSFPRRRHPVVVNSENCGSLIDNPDLLRVMELKKGLLVPLLHGDRACGVLKLFFQRDLATSADLKKWLVTAGSTLMRALFRTYRYQAAQKMATIDGLTGLHNHRYFMEQMQKEFSRARRYRNWLSMIIIDIDHFKEYNDLNGHLAGDRVLKRVARTIKRSVREIDLVARWGGEEFALLLPEINLENGMVVAEKIRKEVEAQNYKNQRLQPEGNLTISLGVAVNSSELKSYRDLFKHADLALYQAKHQGRNRCVPANA